MRRPVTITIGLPESAQEEMFDFPKDSAKSQEFLSPRCPLKLHTIIFHCLSVNKKYDF